jgi:hypothetical protein
MFIKPIQTRYQGYNFRSRLEARWAVFFDALNINWEYESEGYVLPNGKNYLPDFYLPQVNMYVEVKPKIGFDEIALSKCKELVMSLKCGILLAEGMPGSTPVINGYEYGEQLYEDDGTYINPNPDEYIAAKYQYHLWNPHNYHQCEGRFYNDPGWYPNYVYYMDEIYKNIINEAANKAKSARFEFGQNGPT